MSEVQARRSTPSDAANKRPTEFTFSDADFKSISNLVFEETGIHLPPRKRDMLYGRLARRCRALDLPSVTEYRDFLTSPNGASEMMNLINAVTTNHTRFFREDHHFDHLQNEALPEMYEAIRRSRGALPPKLRIWSAGCSSGEEPYTIAMCIAASKPPPNIDIKLLATDLDTEILAKAARAEYAIDQIEQIPARYRTYFKKGGSDNGQSTFTIAESIRSFVHFKKLNFMNDWPVKGPFDIIFCRNVLIYFVKETKDEIVGKFARLLKPGGYLYLGHADSPSEEPPNIRVCGKTIRQRNPNS